MLFSSPEALHCTAATERARRGREVIAAVVELGQGAELALQAYKAVITFLGISVLQIRFLNNVSSVEER